MDPILNPYAPGAGVAPPELAGRDELLAKASIALQRIVAGRFGRSLILTGLRGVGKSPAHGETAFTVPLFDVFMKRMMPSL